jgi:hypothetical protein
MLPNLRYEKKFLGHGSTLAEALAMVRRHPAAFRETYPPRIVNNIYLDSPARHDYQDHIQGAANRSKTRVRWYGQESGAIERPALERKLKRGLVSGKETYALRPISINGTPLQSLLTAAFAEAGLPEMLQSVLRHREPSLFNRYRRHYFLSRDGNFRLTVDSELEFGGGPASNGSRTSQLNHCSMLIIELKFGLEQAEHAALVTDSLPFRLTRCSKYVLGIQRRTTA